jgi:hypothetical protein
MLGVRSITLHGSKVGERNKPRRRRRKKVTDQEQPPPPGIWNNETSWCFIHEVQESIAEDCWEVCFECKHVYNTKQDFVDAYNAVIKEMRENTQYPAADKTKLKDITLAQADSIGFCQFCMHDFL